MPASVTAIMKNVERMARDVELLAIWKREAQLKNDDGTERTTPQAWTAFIQSADGAKIADRIPGTVGKAFAAKYAAEPKPQPKTAPKRTTRKPSSKAASK